MKPILFLLFITLLSCAPRGHYLTTAQVRDTTAQAGTFDTLSAYRKAPGAPRNIKVHAYTKKDGTVVKEHYRSAKNKAGS
jgi:hypothetical protein